jgi:hypothetical protein
MAVLRKSFPAKSALLNRDQENALIPALVRSVRVSARKYKA